MRASPGTETPSEQPRSRPATDLTTGRVNQKARTYQALVEAAVHANRRNAPDLELYEAVRDRRDTTVARLSVARKIGKRAYHVLRELELAA